MGRIARLLLALEGVSPLEEGSPYARGGLKWAREPLGVRAVRTSRLSQARRLRGGWTETRDFPGQSGLAWKRGSIKLNMEAANRAKTALTD